MRDQWPLLGREIQLARAEDALRGNGRGVLLAGIAGVGKTRLASEVERRLKGKWSVIVLHATRAMGGFAFGAFAPLLTSDDDSASAQSQARVLRDSMLALERLSGGRQTLLVVDDVQWLDDGSAVLLAQLVDGGHAKVVLTQRTGEPVPDAVQALWKDQRIERIDLGRLDSESIRKLVEATLDGPADSIAANELERISQGNPLYLRELLRSTLDSGRLRKVGDRWRLDDGRLWMAADTSDDAAGHAERLSELIGQSMAGLAGGQRQLLEMVAFAEPIPLAWIDSAEHADDLHQLERRNLLRIDGHALRPQLHLAHPLYGEVLRSSAMRFEQERVYRQLIEAAEAHGELSRNDEIRIALWRLRSRLPADPAAVLRAAQRARSAGDLMAANELGKAAMEIGGGAMAAYLLGEMLDYFGRSNEAVAVLEAAHPVGDEEVAVIAMARADAMFWGQGRTDEAIEVSVHAERTVTSEPWTSSLRAQRAKLLAFARRYPEAAAIANPLLDHPSARVVADASIPAALAAVHSGSTLRSVAIARRGLEIRQRLDDVLQVTGIEVHRSHLMTNLSEAGMSAEALQMCRREHAAGVAANSVAAMVWYGLALSRLELLAGQTDVALRLAVEADHITSTTNVSGFRLSLTFEALAHAYRGNGRGAAATIERMDAAHPATILTFVVEESRARAWQIAAAGEIHRACLALLATADEAASCGQRTHEAQALHDIVRIGEAPLALDRLEVLAGVIDGSLHTARLAHARGLVAGDADAVAAVADTFEAMGATLLAAEAAGQSAELRRGAGDRRTLVAASRRAHDLRQRCPGAATPALLTAEAVVPLTGREREVALMAATGLSSREVADRLICSPRTVETHLQNAYQKLGVTTRLGLADALGLPRP